jgi:hypothetical protein
LFYDGRRYTLSFYDNYTEYPGKYVNVYIEATGLGKVYKLVKCISGLYSLHTVDGNLVIYKSIVYNVTVGFRNGVRVWQE